MITPQEKQTPITDRGNALHAEQLLCNEALETGEYDAVSDKAWIDLCEKAAKRGKEPDVL